MLGPLSTLVPGVLVREVKSVADERQPGWARGQRKGLVSFEVGLGGDSPAQFEETKEETKEETMEETAEEMAAMAEGTAEGTEGAMEGAMEVVMEVETKRRLAAESLTKYPL